MDLLIIVHIKSSYEAWKAIFNSNPATREEFADESRTRVAKADDNTAMVQLFDVDTVEHIMTHELGHSISLGHSTNPESMMYPSISNTDYAYCLLN